MTAMLRSSSERFVFKLGRQAFSTLATNEVRLPPLFTKVGTRLNPHTAWQWRGRNVSGYLEYFRNGFGRSDRGYTLTDLSAELIMRLTRGQLFNTGWDYFAGGLRLEWTPLLTLPRLLMLNRNARLSVQGDYSLAQDAALVFGGSTGLGPRGSEFGGIETKLGSLVYLESPS